MQSIDDILDLREFVQCKKYIKGTLVWLIIVFDLKKKKNSTGGIFMSWDQRTVFYSSDTISFKIAEISEHWSI